ncbi:MAG: FHA domain-containing protein [Armatimonadetes bacterium]|nr:FHA domain-containing protein [Armatimonadota bacterium]
MSTDDLQTHDDAQMADAPVTEEPVVADEPQSEEATACALAKLTVKRGGAETDVEFHISNSAVIGRFDPSVGPIDVDLGPLPEGAYVSRRHAKISHENGVWTIADLGSSNGTFVLRDEFERIETSELADGQEIALGNARMVFRTG